MRKTAIRMAEMAKRHALTYVLTAVAVMSAYACIVTRFKLREAQELLGRFLLSSFIITDKMKKGEINNPSEILIADQMMAVQYVVRQDVKNVPLSMAAWFCVTKGDLPLTNEQRDMFMKYRENYEAWRSSWWLSDRRPLYAQIEEALFHYWMNMKYDDNVKWSIQYDDISTNKPAL